MAHALIARQPDLGTSLLILASGFYVLFLAGLSWRVMGVLLVAAIASAPVMWSMLHEYQRHRILMLFDPSQDALGNGYHTIQATIAGGFRRPPPPGLRQRTPARPPRAAL